MEILIALKSGLLVAAVGLATTTNVRAENFVPANPIVGLGQMRRFATELEAAGECKPDAMVWADQETGYYHFKGTADFGNSATGTFACRIEAAQANYWDTNPFSVIQGRGRAFPINPDLLFKGS